METINYKPRRDVTFLYRVSAFIGIICIEYHLHMYAYVIMHVYIKYYILYNVLIDMIYDIFHVILFDTYIT